MTVRLVVKDETALSTPSDVVVIPLSSHIQRKRALFGVMRKYLRLPNLYRDNWDALFDVMRDPDSFTAGKSIILDHASLPFPENSPQRTIYLEFLQGLLAESESVPGEVLISLPAAEAAAIEVLRRVKSPDRQGT